MAVVEGGASYRGGRRICSPPVSHPVVSSLFPVVFPVLLGVQGMARTVIVVAAALPIGANVFLFSQRYRVAEAQVTAAVGVSTLLALATVSLVVALMGLPA